MKFPASPALDDLRVFCMVARKSSFSAAAEALCASAAYVSKRVGVLEASLGTRLLHRSTRRVAMTAAGERVLRFSPPLVVSIGELEEGVRKLGHALSTLRADA